MRTLSSELGDIHITPEFVTSLVTQSALRCDGVADLAGGAALSIQALFSGRETTGGKGIRIKKEDDGLTIELHVIIRFGVVIAEVVKEVVSAVRFSVEDCVDIPVSKVDVYVDGMKNET